MRVTIVPCKECHEHPCTCEEEEIEMEIIEEYYEDEGDVDDKTQTIHSNTILCSLYTLALVRHTV